MARSHFAIERPRKISISIEGYNAEAQTQAQKRKQLERSRRLKRKAEAAEKQQRKALPTSTPVARPQQRPRLRAEDVEEVEALSRAACSPELGDEVERELRAAFATQEGRHEDE